MPLKSEELIIGVISQEMVVFSRRVIEMGSRGHIVRQLHVNSLDNSLCERGKCGERGEER